MNFYFFKLRPNIITFFESFVLKGHIECDRCRVLYIVEVYEEFCIVFFYHENIFFTDIHNFLTLFITSSGISLSL